MREAAPPESLGRRSVGDRKRRVRCYFDRVAGRYDLANTVMSLGLHHLWKRLAVRWLSLQTGDRVADICGGTGDLAVLAAPRVGGAGRVFIYDFSREMLNRGRTKAGRTATPRVVRLVQGDAQRLAFRSAGLDAAIVGFGIRNLTDLEGGFREIHRVLKPGGRFVCLEFSQPPRAWFRRLYDLYSYAVMPLVGRLLAGCREAYTYLPDSIRAFPLPDVLAECLVAAGFRQVTYRRLTGGIAVIHRGVKP
ncbi:MAG: bifunctional demethylmenaquinone methyltransferase/2-methoxy-6-polyprenyl-1,4-benzoquinol methylase UbiE [Deltaproteobacteria bacterium]|nr:bifunctional demethylmenaquinone methyltransferase/2-methoxy-6-polyprenyl-1,4-benzoquinol methylase UbiE [Deltaproteobacteria bacterium]